MFASPFVMHCSILFWTILQATAEGCPGDELIHYPLSLVTREPFREKRVGGDELHVCCQASVHWRCTKQLTRYSRRCPRKSEKFSIGDGAKQEEESIYKYPLGKPVSPQHFSHAKVAHRPSLNASYEWGYRRLLHEYEGVATSGGRAAPLPGRGRHGARNFVNDLYKVLEKLVSKRNCMEILSPPSAGKNFGGEIFAVSMHLLRYCAKVLACTQRGLGNNEVLPKDDAFNHGTFRYRWKTCPQTKEVRQGEREALY